jgi:signal transduction histidine kinase
VSLQLRLYLLAVALLLSAVLTSLTTHRTEKDEVALLMADAREKLRHDTTHWWKLSGRSMQRFVEDYSWWDDMVDFVQDPDSDWAADNLEDMWDFWGVSGMWVLDTTGRQVYRLTHPDYPAYDLPLDRATLLTITGEQPFAHFFRWTPAGLLELRTAPVQPDGDDDRITPSQGWFIVGRIWDEAFLQSLCPDSGYIPSLQRSHEVHPPDTRPDAVAATHPLRDEQGRTIALWTTTRPFSPGETGMRGGLINTTLLLMMGITITVAFASLIHLWVIKPIRQVNRALLEKNPEPLASLARQNHELGKIGRLMRDAFAQEEALRRETMRRRQTETELRHKEEGLRAAMSERTRLGTDLHDSTIQILYASGLNLAAIEKQVAGNDPDCAGRIKEIRRNLQMGINDLRWFISHIETDASAQSLNESIDAILALLRNTNQMAVTSKLDPTAADQLSLDQRTHLLQIMREAVTNVLRHAQADHLWVTLQALSHQVKLTVEDDGIGLPGDPSHLSSGGLHNMYQRSRQANAGLVITPREGGGTRVDLSFSTHH